MTMKLKQLITTLAFAAGLTTTASAATPVASWNGDLADGSKKGTWTMTAGTGCTFADGQATTKKSGGSNAYTGLILTPDADSFTANDMTIMVEYSGLEYGNTSKGGHCFLTVTSGSSEYMAGVIPGSQKKARVDCGNEKSCNWNDVPTEGLMIVSFTSSSSAAKKGVRLYFAGKNEDGTYKPFSLAIYNESLATPATYSAIRIGGSTKNGGTYYRPKMVIKSVSIQEGNSEEIGVPYPFVAFGCEELSDTGYVTKTLRMFRPNTSLASLSNALFTAYANGASISHKDSVASSFFPTYQCDENGVLTNMQVRLCFADNSDKTSGTYVKNLLFDLQQVGNDVKYIAVSAGLVSGRTTEVTPTTKWTQTQKIATKASGEGYGMHHLTAVLPAETYVTTISESTKNFSDLTWLKDPPVGGFDLDARLVINVEESSTLTFDVPLTAGLVEIVSASGKTLSLAAGANLPDVVAFDFSTAKGDVTLGFNPGVAAITVGEGNQLTVTASGLTSAKVINNGTIKFVGGTAEAPIEYSNSGAGLGEVVLAENAYVKCTQTVGDAAYDVTGAGESSCFEVERDTGKAVGILAGSTFHNLTYISAAQDVGQSHWLAKDSFDETVDLVIKSGSINGNGNNITIRSLQGAGNVNNGTFTIVCGKAAEYSGASAQPFVIGGTEAQTISGAYTGALTVNSGAKVVLAGDAAPSSIVNNGTVEYLSGSTCYIRAARTMPQGYILPDDVNIVATQTAAEFGTGKAVEITGLADGKSVTFERLDGTSETLVAAGGKVTFSAGTPKIDGAATLFDCTFTNLTDVGKKKGTFSYKGVSGAELKYDTAATFANTNEEAQVKERGVYIRHHPYIDGAASAFNGLGDFTGVFVGEMSPTANRIFVHFGSSYGSLNGIMIATLADKDAVGVFSNAGGTLTELTTLSVPNAATARHVYIVTKKEVEGDTVFTIYLDGVKRAEKTLAGTFVLGSSSKCGVQVGADFGGEIRKGTYKAVSNVETETGVLNVMRIYDYTLTQAQVTAITGEYPYESQGGLYTRTVAGEVDYAATASWAKSPSTTPAYDVPTGTEQFSPSATMTASAEATVAVNTNSVIDTFTFNGEKMSFVKDDEGTNKVSVGTAIVNAPITIDYGVVDLSKAAISLGEGGAVTFDLTDFPIDQYFSTTKVQMTGLTEESEAITIENVPESKGRSVSLGFEEGVYYLTVTVDTTVPFVYTIGEGEETGVWTWGEQEVDEAVVDANLEMPIQKEGAGTLTKKLASRGYTVNGGLFKTTSASGKTATITVNKGGAFDINGSEDGYITMNLNGGTLLNNGATFYANQRQMQSLTLTDDSTVGGTGHFGLIANDYGTNVLELGKHTLTKTGENYFYLCNTIVSNGTIKVEEGTLRIPNHGATFADNAKLVLEEGTMLYTSALLTIGAITADGATINNTSSITPFTLTGSAILTGAGTWGTNTLDNATVYVGYLRGLAFAGAGTVDVALTNSEIGGDEVTVFTTESANVAIGKVYYNDEDVTAKCTITGGTIVAPLAEAKIGTKYYLTLQDALDVGGNVELLALVTNEYTIAAGKTVNLDLGAYSITAKAGRQAINNYGTLTINNGAVTAGEAAIVLWGGSTTTINGGSYQSTDNAVIMGSGNVGETNVTLTVNGGLFTGGITTAGYIACGVYVPNSGTYAIKGGTFNITGGCGICARAGEIKVASEATFTLGGSTEPGKVGDSARPVPCVAMYTDYEAAYPGHAETDYLKAKNNTLSTAEEQGWFGPDDDGYYMLAKIGDAEAKIGNTYYLTLQDALDVGGNVELLALVTNEYTIAAGKTVNLDLGAYSITAKAGRQAINNYGTLTINNGAVTAGEAAIVLWGGSTTTINGGSYQSTDNAVIMGSGNVGEGNVTLTINGGLFTGGITTAGYIACGVYVPNSGTYAIKGGTFNITGGCGICARAGTTKIDSGVTFNVTGSGEGKVGDKGGVPAGVDVFFDWSDPAYPGYTENDAILSQVNTLTTSTDQEWSKDQTEGYYTLQVKSPIEPIDPSQEDVIECKDADAATVLAAAITLDPASFVKAPAAVTDPADVAKYQVLYCGRAYENYVFIELTEKAIEDLQAEVDASTVTESVAAALVEPTATSVTIQALTPGLYYWVEGAETPDFEDLVQGSAGMATASGISLELVKPDTVGTSGKQFYKIAVGTMDPNPQSVK